MFAEHGAAYFRVSGLNDDVEFADGKLWQQTYGALGGELLRLMAQGRILPEYFRQDFQTEHHLKFSEQLSNWLHSKLLDEPAAYALLDAFDPSPVN